MLWNGRHFGTIFVCLFHFMWELSDFFCFTNPQFACWTGRTSVYCSCKSSHQASSSADHAEVQLTSLRALKNKLTSTWKLWPKIFSILGFTWKTVQCKFAQISETWPKQQIKIVTSFLKTNWILTAHTLQSKMGWKLHQKQTQSPSSPLQSSYTFSPGCPFFLAAVHH